MFGIVLFLKTLAFFWYQESGNNELAKSLLNELGIIYFLSTLRIKMGIKHSPVNFGRFLP